MEVRCLLIYIEMSLAVGTKYMACLVADGALGKVVDHRDKRICKSLTNEYSLSILITCINSSRSFKLLALIFLENPILLLVLISTMEQLLTISQNITTIFGAIISILALIVLMYLIVLSAKFNRLMKQINSTAESVQQLSMLPLNALTTILNKLLWPSE